MHDVNENDDQRLHENLRRIGRLTPQPAEPTAAQRASWKQLPPPRLVPVGDAAARAASRGGLRMFKRGYFFPITTAAAVLLAGLLLTIPTRQTTVEAATILASLRSTLYRGLSLDIRSAEIGGVRIDGQLGLAFDQPFRMRDITDETRGAQLQPSLLTGDLHVEFTQNAEELRGWKAQIAMTFAGDQQWIYVKSDDVAPLAQTVGPMIMMVGPAIQNGLLLDLNGMLENDGPAGLSVGAAAPPAPSESRDANACLSVSVGVGNAEGRNHPACVGMRASFHPIQRSDDHAPAPFEELLRRLLEGGLTADDVDSLVAQIEKHNAQATVEQIEPGLYALTMRHLDKLDPSYANESILQNTVLTIAYREGAGVEWIKLANIGPTSGDITIRLLSSPDRNVVAQRETYVVEGRTTVLNLGAWAKMFDVPAESTPTEQEPAPE